MITIRVEYDSVMGEVHRVFDAVAEALDERGEVWVSPEDAIAGRSDSDFEPAKGTAVIDVDAASREEAQTLVVRALRDADPEGEVVRGGDIVCAPPSVWRAQVHDD